LARSSFSVSNAPSIDSADAPFLARAPIPIGQTMGRLWIIGITIGAAMNENGPEESAGPKSGAPAEGAPHNQAQEVSLRAVFCLNNVFKPGHQLGADQWDTG
jgi:hypothetical protein